MVARAPPAPPPRSRRWRHPQERLSYAELLAAARAGAGSWRERGARSGERVAIALPPGLDFAVALHACFLLGAVAVPVDLRLTAAEREHVAGGAAAGRRAPRPRGFGGDGIGSRGTSGEV